MGFAEGSLRADCSCADTLGAWTRAGESSPFAWEASEAAGGRPNLPAAAEEAAGEEAAGVADPRGGRGSLTVSIVVGIVVGVAAGVDGDARVTAGAEAIAGLDGKDRRTAAVPPMTAKTAMINAATLSIAFLLALPSSDLVQGDTVSGVCGAIRVPSPACGKAGMVRGPADCPAA